MEKKGEENLRLREELQGKKRSGYSNLICPQLINFQLIYIICRLEILIQDLREKLQHLESENRNLTQRINEQSPITDHQKELLLQNRLVTSDLKEMICFSKRLKSCSAPPSIMAGSLEGQAGGLADSGEELSNEWEVRMNNIEEQIQ